jgi:hypothetical protein
VNSAWQSLQLKEIRGSCEAVTDFQLFFAAAVTTCASVQLKKKPNLRRFFAFGKCRTKPHEGEPGQSKKPKVWPLISLQKTENRDYVGAFP